MGCKSVRLSQYVWIGLLSVFVTLSVLVYRTAGAQVYDDFNGENIDTTKWTIRSTPDGAPGLFTQSKGHLNFLCKKDAGESLISTKSFQPGFFRIEFYDFYSTNDAPSGRGMGSFAALGLGPRDNYVRMLRGRVGTGGYFEANHFTNNGLNLWYDRTMAGSGQLALYYDGSMVSFFYNLGLDPNKGWQRVGPRVTPEWNSPPQLFISGYPGPSGLTKFAVDNVEYAPLPLPSSLSKRLER
jgi:hypothetical protein